MSYVTNDYGSNNKTRARINGLVSPMIFTKMGYRGAFLYTDKVLHVEQNKLHWFKTE